MPYRSVYPCKHPGPSTTDCSQVIDLVISWYMPLQIIIILYSVCWGSFRCHDISPKHLNVLMLKASEKIEAKQTLFIVLCHLLMLVVFLVNWSSHMTNPQITFAARFFILRGSLFCHEILYFAMTYFYLVMRFFILQWDFFFCVRLLLLLWRVCFHRETFGPPYSLWWTNLAQTWHTYKFRCALSCDEAISFNLIKFDSLWNTNIVYSQPLSLLRRGNNWYLQDNPMHTACGMQRGSSGCVKLPYHECTKYHPKQYGQLSLKRTPSGPKLLSALERCPL